MLVTSIISLFSTVFSKFLSQADKTCDNFLLFILQFWLEKTLNIKRFENIVGKGEKADNMHLYLLSTLIRTQVICKCFQFGPGLNFVTL